MQVSTPQDKNLQNLPMKMVDPGKQQEDNQPCPPKHIYAEISQKNKTEKLESIQEENNKSTPQEEEHEEDEVKYFDATDDEEPATNNTKCKRQKPAKPAKLNHQQQVTEVTGYLWAHKASDSALKKMDLADETEYIKHHSIAQYEEAYPWEKEAENNRKIESPLSFHIQKIKEGANKLLLPSDEI